MRALSLAVDAVVTWVTAALTAGLVILTAAMVFGRYVLGQGLPWLPELARLLFVWIVFLGAYLALRDGSHLAITAAVSRLPAKLRRGALIGGQFLVAVLLIVIAISGADLVIATFSRGVTTPAMGISAGWGYVPLPVASLLMLAHTLRHLVGLIRGSPLPPTQREPIESADGESVI